jgi:hypothetical protein
VTLFYRNASTGAQSSVSMQKSGSHWVATLMGGQLSTMGYGTYTTTYQATDKAGNVGAIARNPGWNFDLLLPCLT